MSIVKLKCSENSEILIGKLKLKETNKLRVVWKNLMSPNLNLDVKNLRVVVDSIMEVDNL